MIRLGKSRAFVFNKIFISKLIGLWHNILVDLHTLRGSLGEQKRYKCLKKRV